MKRATIPRNAEAEGIFSLVAAVGSILTLATFLLSRRIGFDISADVGWGMLLAYAFLEVAALKFGYNARNTKFGRWGFTAATVWAALLAITGFVILLTTP